MRRDFWAMLVVLTVSCGGWADEADAVKAVTKLGGDVLRDDKALGKPVVGVYLQNTQATDTDLKQVREFDHLQELNLGGTKVTDAGLKELRELK
jgi:hypothetical protein